MKTIIAYVNHTQLLEFKIFYNSKITKIFYHMPTVQSNVALDKADIHISPLLCALAL